MVNYTVFFSFLVAQRKTKHAEPNGSSRSLLDQSPS